MPFGLINARETFQRAMDIAFRGLINKCVVAYLDDVIVYSKNRKYHIQHLTQIFERCRKYEIYLNPKKTIFGVKEGKLLSHIIFQAGICIDPKEIKAITQLPLPHNKKAMQSFFGKINFVRKFTPDFAETIKPLQKVIRKDVDFKGMMSENMLSTISRPQYLKLRCCEVQTLVKIFSSILLPSTNP
jgi:hypothetical protein